MENRVFNAKHKKICKYLKYCTFEMFALLALQYLLK